ncbi:MAG: PA14 domain-containing protein [Tepidisphaerales bacterium]
MPSLSSISWCVALGSLPLFLAAARPGPAPLAGEAVRVGVAATPMAVPDAESQARAEKTVREVFAKDYLLRQPAERAALAAKLLDEAARTDDDPAALYVLLREARDIAASVADVSLLSQALRRLEARFQVKSPAETLATLVAANRAAVTQRASGPVARACLVAADRTAVLDDLDTAGRLAAVARSAADRAHDQPLILRAIAKEKELALLAAERGKSLEAADVLKQKPDDPAANLATGAYLCCVRNDWTAGLPLLARSPESPLRTAAQLDLSSPDEPGRQLDLANQFWDLATAESGLKRAHLQQRAALWYRKALVSLTGLNRSAAESRLVAIDADFFRDRGLAGGLQAELFRGSDFSQPVKKRIDPAIDFDWGLDVPDPAVPKNGFSIRWTGLVRLPSPGRYEITAIANAGARVWLDGKLIIDGPNLSRRPKGEKVLIDAESILLPLRVDYWDTSGTSHMRLLWRTPESLKEEPLPASACWHEVR